MGEKTFCRRVLPIRMRIRKMGIYCLRHRSRLNCSYFIGHTCFGIYFVPCCRCIMAATMLRAAEVNLFFWNRHDSAFMRYHGILRLILRRFFAYNIQYCAIINFTDMRSIFLMRLHIPKRFQMVVLHSASPILSRYLHAQVFIIKKWYGAKELWFWRRLALPSRNKCIYTLFEWLLFCRCVFTRSDCVYSVIPKDCT